MPHVDTKNMRISFIEAGAKHGKPVLLLHGWPDDASTWDNVSSRLAKHDLRLIAPYLRGFGGSVFLNEDALRTANSEILAMDAIALMDGLGIDTFSVVGHDWGAGVTEALAVGWSDRVERMALVSSLPRMGGLKTPSFQQAQRYWYHWFMATKRGAEAIAENPHGFTRIQWKNWGPDGWFDEATFDAVSKSFDNPDWVAVTLHSYQARWGEADVDPASKWLETKIWETKSLSLPTLYFQGLEDGVNPPELSETLHEKFSGPFQRIVLQNVGHFPQREDPDTVARELAVFLGS